MHGAVGLIGWFKTLCDQHSVKHAQQPVVHHPFAEANLMSQDMITTYLFLPCEIVENKTYCVYRWIHRSTSQQNYTDGQIIDRCTICKSPNLTFSALLHASRRYACSTPGMVVPSGSS